MIHSASSVRNKNGFVISKLSISSSRFTAHISNSASNNKRINSPISKLSLKVRVVKSTVAVLFDDKLSFLGSDV